jgi:hypothetical protein
MHFRKAATCLILPDATIDHLYWSPAASSRYCGPLLVDTENISDTALVYLPETNLGAIEDVSLLKSLQQIQLRFSNHILATVGWFPDDRWPLAREFFARARGKLFVPPFLENEWERLQALSQYFNQITPGKETGGRSSVNDMPASE